MLTKVVADGVSAAAQAKRINALAQIAGSVLANLEPLALLAGQPTRSSLELGLDSNPDTLTTFASMNVNDRRGSVDQSIGRSALLAIHALRTRQSDAGLRLSSASFSTRPRMLDAGLGLYEV
ncbi:hypothetical protein FRC10_002143 [Ceratobasidium sp. 414]|nr:hypothetical protein FRC10_002143 [Ceratobasidium sp. 414]